MIKIGSADWLLLHQIHRFRRSFCGRTFRLISCSSRSSDTAIGTPNLLAWFQFGRYRDITGDLQVTASRRDL